MKLPKEEIRLQSIEEGWILPGREQVMEAVEAMERLRKLGEPTSYETETGDNGKAACRFLQQNKESVTGYVQFREVESENAIQIIREAREM